MAKTKLVVTTDVGVFTRTTARTYTHLVAVGPYTDAFVAADAAWKVAHPRLTPFTKEEGLGVWGWAGRLDLARKAADQARKVNRFDWVRIYDVATGQLVGGL